ncbi:MATE family efflux transporter [Pseudodesulfovibrio sp.]|uniref:MATE family efflux transporter n=1 Tax=unclassified Pseudodesulfovibrio TaxID=2661612 RepID=UPI003AFFACE4
MDFGKVESVRLPSNGKCALVFGMSTSMAEGEQQGVSSRHPFIDRPNRTLVGLALPVLFSLVAEPLTGIADTAFVARIPGPEPVAALGIGTVAFSSIFWAFSFLGIGTQTEVSHDVGRGNTCHAEKNVSLACVLAIGVGICLLLLLSPFLRDIAVVLGAQGRVADLAREYMFYRLIGAPAVLVSVAAFGALRGVQDMRTPLYVAVAVNGINIVLDRFLIFGGLGIPAFGVAGAAVASSLSQWVGAIWTLIVVAKRIGLTLRMRGAGVRRLLSIGGDLFVRTGLLLVFLGLCTRVANRFGAEEGAAYQAIRQFFVFAALFLDAFAITGQSLVGYFIGARAVAQARRVAEVVCLWSMGTGAVLAVLMLAGQGFVAWLLVPPSAVDEFGPGWVVLALSLPVGALSFATDGIHWGTGDFRYLRNAMLVASAVGAAHILLIEHIHPAHAMVHIWVASAVWTAFRGGFGIIRIWPGVWDAPLKARG